MYTTREFVHLGPFRSTKFDEIIEWCKTTFKEEDWKVNSFERKVPIALKVESNSISFLKEEHYIMYTLAWENDFDFEFK